MKPTTSYIYTLFLALLCCFLGGENAWAQRPSVSTLGSQVQRKVEMAGIRALNQKKSALRRETRQKFKELPGKLKDAGSEQFNDNPPLDQLIDDPRQRAAVVDKKNDKRFVHLFGQWWAMPSDNQLKLEAEARKWRDSIFQQNQSNFRIPRLVTPTQFVTIFGWHQWWMGNRYESYRFNLLSAISFYSYDLDPLTGGYRDPKPIHEFMKGDFIKRAKQDTCNVLLTVSCHGKDDIVPFLDRNLYAQRNLIDTLLYILDSTGADGVELNFEGIPLDYKQEYVNFVRVLSHSLRNANPEYRIAMSVPARDPRNIYDLAEFEEYVNFFIIMGYNFHIHPDLKEPHKYDFYREPLAPLNYNPVSPDYDLRSCVEKYISNIGALNSTRLVLALPFFGTKWSVSGQTSIYDGPLTYRDIQFNYVQEIPDSSHFERDKNVFTWKFFDPNTNVNTIIYYEDTSSLKKKYDFLFEYRLGGLGIWSLGYDSGFEHLWDQIEEEFTEYVPPEDERILLAKRTSSSLQRNSTIILTVLLYIAIFATIGFCFALFNLEVRQKLFANGTFRLFYLGFFTIIVIILGVELGLFRGNNPILVLGIIFGAFFTWLAMKFTAEQQAQQP